MVDTGLAPLSSPRQGWHTCLRSIISFAPECGGILWRYRTGNLGNLCPFGYLRFLHLSHLPKFRRPNLGAVIQGLPSRGRDDSTARLRQCFGPYQEIHRCGRIRYFCWFLRQHRLNSCRRYQWCFQSYSVANIDPRRWYSRRYDMRGCESGMRRFDIRRFTSYCHV